MADLKKKAHEVRDLFRQTANTLDDHFDNVKIARAVGSSVAATGGVAAIGGLILAPFTAGLSLIPAGIGAGISAAGGVTAGGASIVGTIIERNTFKDMSEKWDEVRKELVKLVDLRLTDDEIEAQVKELFGTVGGAVGDIAELVSAFKAFRSGAGGVITAGATGVEVAGATGAEVAAVATGARIVAVTAAISLNVVGLGFSLYDMIDASIAIHNNHKSPVGNVLRNMADQLEKLDKLC